MKPKFKIHQIVFTVNRSISNHQASEFCVVKHEVRDLFLNYEPKKYYGYGFRSYYTLGGRYTHLETELFKYKFMANVKAFVLNILSKTLYLFGIEI